VFSQFGISVLSVPNFVTNLAIRAQEKNR
jgi:hypothetical protein